MEDVAEEKYLEVEMPRTLGAQGESCAEASFSTIATSRTLLASPSPPEPVVSVVNTFIHWGSPADAEEETASCPGRLEWTSDRCRKLNIKHVGFHLVEEAKEDDPQAEEEEHRRESSAGHWLDDLQDRYASLGDNEGFYFRRAMGLEDDLRGDLERDLEVESGTWQGEDDYPAVAEWDWQEDDERLLGL